MLQGNPFAMRESMNKQTDIHRYLRNWQDEIESAYLYSALSKVEPQPTLADVYCRLALTEQTHAKVWEEKLLQAKYPIPKQRIGWRTRCLALFAQWFGPQFVLPTINAMEQVDSHSYDAQPDTHNTQLPIDERSHARLLQAITAPNSHGMSGKSLAQIEGRHRTAGGNSLRAAVLGASDGLLSNLSLVMGVAGANLTSKSILVTGIAGLLAGSCSMALGEWLSVQSSRELYERQIEIEGREIADVPDEEEEELALIYEAKGLKATQARTLAAKMMANHVTALDTLAREELGIDPDELGGSAWVAAITSFFLFAIGAVIPVLPFIVLTSKLAVYASLLLSGLGLFLIGAAITLLTGRSVLYSGTRQVVFGFIAAAITFWVGRLIGVVIH
jgi:vacuolar iron transporter family protein